MPVSPEAIQGYLMQAGLNFGTSDHGANGHFMLSFKTKRYINPEGEKSLMLLITVGEDGRYIELAACNMYSAAEAKSIGRLSELLLDINFRSKLLRFELDRSDGEIRATAEAVPQDGSVTFQSFMRMLTMFPSAADRLHPSITKVLKTGRLPRATGRDKRLEELVRRAGGFAALEKLVDENERVDICSPELDEMMRLHLQSLAEKKAREGGGDAAGKAGDEKSPPSSPAEKPATPSQESTPPPKSAQPPRIEMPDCQFPDDLDEDDDDDDGFCSCDEPLLE
jgi:hypothetical protein